ncbi:cysteine hydrolase family protein [Acetivibrio cellulolyticus]|uniref:cysteine hydrolase family protein n=1 Tax=Acetivibrio cellulolyticus TaxID=35830 RepID=UPI0001E2BD98|nr:isochorismatase family cysteine hydrolase [Acetivibrio cellulolyticus]
MKKVLFVMDLQEDTTGTTASKGPFPIREHQQLIDAVNERIEAYKAAGDEIAYIAIALPNKWFFRKVVGIAIKGTPGCSIDRRIKIVGNHYFEKMKPSAFANKNLVRWIKDNEVTHVEITGIDAAQCCAATAEEAVKLGLEAVINRKATATTVPHKLPKVNAKLTQLGVKFMD